ncbi:MAG: hypothetical protein DRR06_16290 [Gammaproteobacteria bacterium]|nr:MAG: hypothetical protein DRR06_16290 [Gammaproteobacteria bacterium]
MPSRALKSSITQELVDNINAITGAEELRDSFREGVIGYADVLQEGRFKVSSYLEAVMYVSYKLLGNTNIVSYAKTFPHRYARYTDPNSKTTDRDIASYVSAYNSNKLVNLIFQQTMVPTYVLNADMHQRALNVQADLMMNARSEKVRSDAANSLLTHLKVPEAVKVSLEIGLKEDRTIQDLRETTAALVKQQKTMLIEGVVSPQEVAHSKIIPKVPFEEKDAQI